MTPPRDFAELLQQWPKIQELIAFAAALRKCEFITPYGTRIPIQPSRENAIVDLRALTPTGVQSQPVIPSQTGNEGKFLQTDGTEVSWVIGPSNFTSMERVAAQSIPSGTSTAIEFDTELSNDAGLWSASANTRFTFTAATAGKYLFTGSLRFAGAAGGVRSVSVRVNGTTDLAVSSIPVDSSSDTAGNAVGFRDMVAGDYVELRAFQNSGGSINVNFGMKLDCIRLTA